MKREVGGARLVGRDAVVLGEAVELRPARRPAARPRSRRGRREPRGGFPERSRRSRRWSSRGSGRASCRRRRPQRSRPTGRCAPLPRARAPRCRPSRPCRPARRLRAGTRRRSARARRGSARRSSSACRRDARGRSSAHARRRFSRSGSRGSPLSRTNSDANGVSGFLVINPRSGPGDSADELRAAAERMGVETHLLGEGEDPGAVARKAPEGPLGIAGGDGSLAAVAEVALERGSPFVVVPSGTLNHFARDLGLDRDEPEGGAAGVLRPRDSRRRRPRQRPALPEQRLAGALRAARSRRGRGRLVRSAEGPVDAAPAASRARRHGRRDACTRTRARRLEQRVQAARALDRRARTHRRGAAPPLSRARIPTDLLGGAFVHEPRRSRPEAGSLEAAIDGEPEMLETPLEFRIEPAALRVLLPES